MGECLITRRGGESYELPVLDENYPEDVTLTVIKGNTVSATFSAVFATHGKPAEYTYQWYVDGTAVEGANSSLFTMTGLGETVNQSVYCEITNKAGTVTTRVATLKVTQHYTPVLNASYPANVTLNDGSTTSATFKVQIDTAGNPASYTYQWYVNGTAVPGATSATYTRTGIVTKGTWTVYCKVTNAAGTVQSRTATLTVKHTILYVRGDECTANTGGWSIGKGTSASNYTQGTVKKNSSNVSLSISGAYNGIAFYTKNKINLTNYKTLKINVTAFSNSNTSNTHMYLMVDSDIDWSNGRTGDVKLTSTGTFSLSVSGQSSSYYVTITGWSGEGMSVTIDKIWLE